MNSTDQTDQIDQIDQTNKISILLGYLLVQTRVDAREVSSLALVGYAHTRQAELSHGGG